MGLFSLKDLLSVTCFVQIELNSYLKHQKYGTLSMKLILKKQSEKGKAFINNLSYLKIHNQTLYMCMYCK